MPKASKARKRRSDELSDAENVPPPARADAVAGVTGGLNPKAMRALAVDIQATQLDVQSRCESLESQMETDVATLRQALARQLLRLPPRVRAMSVREFALLHSLSVSSVALESAHSQQQQLAEWVQATPRLNKHSAAAGGGRRELQALLAQPSSLQPYMHLLNTAQRMTRATARKAGLAAQQQQAGAGEATVLSELRHVNGSGPEQTHVFQTPSGRVR